MADFRNDFKEWLSKQRTNEDEIKYTPKTVDDYVRRVNQIYKKNFQHSSRKWDELSEHILPLLAKYYEYTNKEYYLDRVTIWYSLEYFHKILEFLYPAKDITKDDEKTVKLYLLHNKEDYHLATINLKYLYDYTQLFNSFVYRGSDLSTNIKYEDRQAFLTILRKAISKNKIESPQNVAFHIVYEQKGTPQEKAALTQYCSFLYSKFSSPQYDYKSNGTIQLITDENPNRVIGGRYEETRPITGMHSMQIRAKNENMRDDPDCTLTISDLAKILNIDDNTVKKAIERLPFNSDQTDLRAYYSVLSTNEYLEKYYHFIKSSNDCTLKGYDHWCKGRQACKILRMGKTAFYSYELNKKYTHIDYAENSPKYYEPNLK